MFRLLIFSTLSAISVAVLATDIEEPAYRTLGAIDDIEFREYSPSIQARTPLGNAGDTGSGFSRLAGFIFGGNDQSMEIAMTAPVEETLDSKPVMAFTMPSEYDMDDLPVPDDSQVELVEVPSRTVAVIAFSGWATDETVARKTELLLLTLQANGIETIGSPSLNQYNPPWTLPFLRRNEVMVEVAASPLPAEELSAAL